MTPMRILVIGAGGVGSAVVPTALRRDFFEHLPRTESEQILGWSSSHFRSEPMSSDLIAGHVKAVADFYKGSNLVLKAKNRIAGLTLRATDTDWSHGSGPEVAGPMIALLLAMAGRKAALPDLRGDGVETLRARMS